jgi:hypothetical protein
VAYPALAVTEQPPRRLPVAAPKRHPDDGWTLADPYPMRDVTRRALRGLIRALCPPEPALPDLEERIELHVRRMLRYMVPIVALGFVLAVHVVDWAPIWRFAAGRRIQNLDRDRAEHVLSDLGESQSGVVRAMILGVRGLVLSTYFDQDEVHRAMGWEPLPFLVRRSELRQRILAGERATAADRLGTRTLEDEG